MNLGQRLKYARRYRRITQNELAERIGVSRGAITNIELNKVKAPQQIVTAAICNALDINPEWLLYGKGEMENNFERMGIEGDVSKMLLGAISNLSLDEQEVILHIIRLIRELK